MTQYGDYQPRRSDMRKKRRMNMILNSAIGLVVVAIIFFGASLIFGGDSEPVSVDDTDQEENDEELSGDLEESEEQADEDEMNEDNNVGANPDGDNDIDLESESDSDVNGTEEDADENKEEEENENEQGSSVGEGEWEPIGTVQEEPFSAVYDRDHINWDEMTEALQYATNLGDDMTIWRIRNGGDHQSAIGTVSNYENRATPYEVRLEWVTNEGWMPVSVEQLDHNPYRQ